jgi:undecaprenyl-diphosphatase
MDMTVFDSLQIIAWATLVFGVLLYIADKRPQSEQTIADFTIKHAFIYGILQCIALIPGVSRSGITMTAGRFMNHNRTEAARYSLLMGMVTIAAAGILTGVSVFIDSNVTSAFLTQMGIGIFLSFIAAYVTIIVMMRWFKNNGSMTPFVIYRIFLGLGLLGLIYSGVI